MYEDIGRLEPVPDYGQCVFAAPTVFQLRGEEILEYEYATDDSLRGQVERAAATCPVQAISIGRAKEQMEGVR